MSKVQRRIRQRQRQLKGYLSSSPQFSLAELVRLDDFERWIVCLLAVAWPLPLSPTEIAHALKKAGIGYSTTNSKVKVQDALDEFTDLGVVQIGADLFDTYTLAKKFVMVSAVEARRVGMVKPNTSFVSIPDVDNKNRMWDFEKVLLAFDVKKALLLGENVPDEMLAAVEDRYWDVLASPYIMSSILTFPPKIREKVSKICLYHCISWIRSPQKLLENWLPLSEYSPKPFFGWVAFCYIMQGRFDEAIQVFRIPAPKDFKKKPISVDYSSTLALIAMLRGEHIKAAQYIEEAIMAEQPGSRTKNVYPSSIAFRMSLISLAAVQTHEAQLLLESQLQLPPNRTLRLWEHIEIFAQNAGDIVHLGELDYSVVNWSATTLPLHWLFLTLSLIWNDQRWNDSKLSVTTDVADQIAKSLRKIAIDAAANGYLWIAAQANECIKHFNSDLVVNAHTHGEFPSLFTLGAADLCDAIRLSEQWERPLATLESVAASVQSKAKAQNFTEDKTKRLAWRIDYYTSTGGINLNNLGNSDYSGLDSTGVVIVPVEQTCSKYGKWSKGKALSLPKSVTEMEFPDYYSDMDRAAIRNYGADIYAAPYSRIPIAYAGGLLACLVGHPLLMTSDGQHVEVVSSEPEIVVDEMTKGQVQLHTFPEDVIEFQTYQVKIESKTRIKVYRLTENHHRLYDVLSENNLTFPSEIKDRVLAALADLSGIVRVHGDVVNKEVETVDANGHPFVRLLPDGQGLTVDIIVEPIENSGMYFAPAEGGSSVLANLDGHTVQARRDLDNERQLYDQLLCSIPALGSVLHIATSMHVSDPDECLELVDQLREAEVRCLWPEGKAFNIVASTQVSQLRMTVRSAEEWFSASGALKVDEKRVIELGKLMRLLEARPNSRFLELDESQFISLSKSFRQQLDDLASLSQSEKGGNLKFHSLAALALQDFVNETELTADEEWMGHREKIDKALNSSPSLPSTLQAELRPYQLEGFTWLARTSMWSSGACLADDMGLGKTVQTLALLLFRAQNGPALVIAPTSVISNWLDEVRRFAPALNVVLYAGLPISRQNLLKDIGPSSVAVTTYGIVQNAVDQLAKIQWDTIVADEAQAIKNNMTKRARAIYRLNGNFRLAITGTPVQNNLSELYSLFNFLVPGLLGSQNSFGRNFVTEIEVNGNPDTRSRLKRLISPFLLRRLKSEVLDDLPPRTEITLRVDMSEEETVLYEALRRQAVAALENGDGRINERRFEVLSHLTRLRLACCNPKLVQENGSPASSKLEVFSKILEELCENRHKVLVFSQFVKHLTLIEEFLKEKGVGYQYLDGSTTQRQRQERIKSFQSGVGDVFLISLKAGGFGLNLTAADYVIHMDPWWNPAVEDQASDRAHRIGQTRPVTIYRLVAKGGIEEQIIQLHEQKRDLADRLLEGTDSTAMTDSKELLDLLRTPIAV